MFNLLLKTSSLIFIRLVPPKRSCFFMATQYAASQMIVSSEFSTTDKKNMADKTVKDYIVYKKSDDPNAPLVLFFGWAGCQDRYLSKYSQFYDDKGYSIVRYTPPIKKIRGFHSYSTFAQDIYDKVLDNDDKHSIVFHVFSMNGCSLFVALWDLLDSRQNGSDIKKRVKGIVFDSCPANVMPWQAANAISFATLPPPKYGSLTRNTYRMILTGFISSHRALVWLKSMVDSTAFENNFAFFRLLKMEDLPKKQLFIYSNNDEICSDYSIEDFANHQKEKGVDVELQCWKDSLHVEHLRMYPKEYATTCVNFLNKIVEDDNNNPK